MKRSGANRGGKVTKGKKPRLVQAAEDSAEQPPDGGACEEDACEEGVANAAAVTQPKYNPHEDGKGPDITDGEWEKQIQDDDVPNKRPNECPKVACKLDNCVPRKIAFWNVNGMRARIKDNSLINYLVAEAPSILCLAETKLSSSTIDQFETLEAGDSVYKGFHFIGEKKGYAGVAIFIDCALDNLVEDVIYGCGHPEFDKEGRTMALVFTSCVLVTSYVMNSGDTLQRLEERVEQYDSYMHSWLSGLHKKYKRGVIWCGDLNCAREEIDIWNSKGNAKSSGHTKEERASLTKFLDAQEFVDVWRVRNPGVRRYTFWPARSPQQRKANLGWRIDAFIVTEDVSKEVELCTIRDKAVGSDHCPIVISLRQHTLGVVPTTSRVSAEADACEDEVVDEASPAPASPSDESPSKDSVKAHEKSPKPPLIRSLPRTVVSKKARVPAKTIKKSSKRERNKASVDVSPADPSPEGVTRNKNTSRDDVLVSNASTIDPAD